VPSVQFQARLSIISTVTINVRDRLAIAGERLTEPRKKVGQLIAQRRGTFTAADLLDDAGRRAVPIGRATVFRALDLFTDLGLLERIDMPSGEHAYVACDPVHHHHVVCSNCGRQTEVADAGVGQMVDQMERQTGYRIDTHRLEHYGTCPDCRANP
jgi:Fur family ferric uptake transcriptional regulator